MNRWPMPTTSKRNCARSGSNRTRPLRRVSRTVDTQRPCFRCWPVGEDGQDHGHVLNWHPGLVHHSISSGSMKGTNNKIKTLKTGVRLPGPGVLQTQDSGDSRGQVRFNRMNLSSGLRARFCAWVARDSIEYQGVGEC